ncbi:MAG: translocation/assembly module TamB domain-containing protein [Leptolyngbyaceae cyanobacterium bins.302]|nr:translocation/assembly module TamB domain-containing protein [Leptolyngbyaceae cyanobacterium bins.302]
MTHSPTPDRDPNLEPPTPPRRSRRRWQRIAIPVGLTVIAGAGGVAFWGWRFIHDELPGIVAENLSQTLNRPVNVGEVKGVSFSGLVIGESSIPPTAEDTDQATVEEIAVGFNLWQTVWTRKLKLDITLKDAVVFLEQQKEGWITTKFTPAQDEGLIEIGTIRAENATAKLLGLGTIGGKRAPVVLDQLNGKVDLFEENRLFSYDLTGRSRTGGGIKLVGETRLPSQETNLQVQAENFLVSEVDRLLNLPFDLPVGRAGGNFNVELRPNIKNPPINGTAQFAGVTLAIPGVPRPFQNAKGTLQFRGTQILPEDVVGNYGKATGVVNGAIDLNKDFNLSAQVKPIKLLDLTETLKVSVPVALEGTAVANLKVTGAIENPVLTGTARSVGAGKVDRVPISQFNTAFKLDTTAEELVVQRFQATPTAGGEITGSGRVDLSKTDAAGRANPGLAFNILVQNVPGDKIALQYSNGNPLPVTIGTVNAQAQVSGSASAPVTAIRWAAPNATYPGSGEITIANGVTTLRNTRFNVEGGIATVNAIARDGRWQANVAGSGIPLNRFSNDLRGLFSGNFTASGSLSSFRPETIRAQGTARLSEGLSVIEGPLTAQVQWTGQQLVIQQATAKGFNANGTIGLNLEGTPAITALNLNVRLNDFDLRDFDVDLPANVAYAGRADFSGKITGTPTAPSVNGNLALKNFVVNGVAFEPYLSGRVQYTAQGVRIDLRGEQDRIAAVLNSQLQPVAFEIRRGEAIATGRTQGGLLLVDVKQFPLSLAQVPGIPPTFAPDGLLDGTFAIDLNRQTAEGTVVIANPRLGGYQADQFSGQIRYANGIATLINGQLRRGTTVFQIAGAANLLAANPQFKGRIDVAQGDIQDVLEALQIFELADLQQGGRSTPFGSARDLQTVPINTAQISVERQLRRLAEIQALQGIRQAEREAAILPPLSELKGTFTGNVDFAGSLKSGINARFNIRGKDFQWGKFDAEEVVAVGNFQNGELTLLPLRLQSGEAVIAFSGTVLGQNQSGQLRIENFPVEELTELVQIPIAAKGQLNATATISGSFANPQALGEYRLNNAELNGTALQQAQGSFTYANARLDFSNTFALTPQEPLSIVGSLPVEVFGTKADSDRISLDINVRNEGLALLNVLTDQVSWIDGQGEAKVVVRGTLRDPIAVGGVQIQNATLKAKALPEPLTNVNGTARFVQDRIQVDNFSGDFSQGKIAASGVIPLSNPLPANDRDGDTPLTVAMNNISLNLKGLYQGGVNGTVTITGAALDPILSGEIRLSDGQVLLAAADAQNGAGQATGEQPQSPVEFANLKLVLGNGVVLTYQPILRFVARGELTINGDLNNPTPDGTIQLQSGQVNLFTTQFTLDRGYTQTAEFVPGRGLDPELNVRLVALVPEVTARRQPSVLTPSEILDVPAPASSFGSLRTVRVRAQVNGYASRLAESLELTSSPPRSEAEIIALIGGGYVDTLGRGDTLLGIANLAGSALLTNVQTAIGQALGLSEFRLFPTYTANNERDSGDGTSTLGLAAEAAVDITPALSVSVLKILTNSEPAQFGLRYRINDNLLLRSSTNFSDDSRASVEYELRF